MAITRAAAKTIMQGLTQAAGQTLAVATVDAYVALKSLGDATIACNGNPALQALMKAIETACGDHIKA